MNEWTSNKRNHKYCRLAPHSFRCDAFSVQHAIFFIAEKLSRCTNSGTSLWCNIFGIPLNEQIIDFFSSKSHNFGDTQAQALMKHFHQMRSVRSLQFRSISFIVMWLCLNDYEVSTLRVTRSDRLFTFLSRCSLCSDFYDIWSHDQIW